MQSQDYSNEMNRGRGGYPMNNLQATNGIPNMNMNQLANNQNFYGRMQNMQGMSNVATNDQGSNARKFPSNREP